jgi:uncharacterized protein (DUF58 family)
MTRLGWAVAALALACLAAGTALGYDEVLVLGVGCLVALVLAAVLVLVRPKIQLEREIFPLRVTRGEPSVGVLTVRNLSRRLGLRMSATEPFGAREVRVDVPRLKHRQSRRVTYRLPTDRRGVIAVGPLRWDRSDPAGLVRRSQALGSVERLYVNPVTHHVGLAPSGRARHLEGPKADTAPSGTITFHALRDYVRGDDLRRIHWRSSARLGTLMVRELVDTSLAHTTVLLDPGRTAMTATGSRRRSASRRRS